MKKGVFSGVEAYIVPSQCLYTMNTRHSTHTFTVCKDQN